MEETKGLVIKLTKGNLEVLSALERWGILGLGQLDGCVFHKEFDQRKRMELFFNSTNREDYVRTAYKGIKRLEKGGYVRGQSYTNLAKVYMLTGLGHGELRKNGLSKLPVYCGEVAETMVRHELLVSAVGLVLTELMGLRVWTEMDRYLMSDIRHDRIRRRSLAFSDLWIEDRAQPKAVEIERTQKCAARYQALWSDYRKRLPPTGVVLYIACFPGGVKALLRRAERLRADHVYVCDLEAFKASLGRGPFVGFRGGMITLQSPNNQPTPEPLPVSDPRLVPILARPEFQTNRDWRPQ